MSVISAANASSTAASNVPFKLTTAFSNLRLQAAVGKPGGDGCPLILNSMANLENIISAWGVSGSNSAAGRWYLSLNFCGPISLISDKPETID